MKGSTGPHKKVDVVDDMITIGAYRGGIECHFKIIAITPTQVRAVHDHDSMAATGQVVPNSDYCKHPYATANGSPFAERAKKTAEETLLTRSEIHAAH